MWKNQGREGKIKVSIIDREEEGSIAEIGFNEVNNVRWQVIDYNFIGETMCQNLSNAFSILSRSIPACIFSLHALVM